MKKNILPAFRGKCYHCNRPLSSCMCKHVHPIKTKTQFIILMHPKEHQKTKNGTGYMTHLSLPNSKVYRGIDFSNHYEINQLIKLNNCYILYPGEDSINLNKQALKDHQDDDNKGSVIFIIDSTWACSRKILRVSQNLKKLQRISFDNSERSQFEIKTQPKEYCLSTIESTLKVLKLLNMQDFESISESDFKGFLKPFRKMVEYQIACAKQGNLREKEE